MDSPEILKLIGQIIGISAFSVSCTRYFMKKKASIIKLSVFIYILYVIHYFLIDAIGGSYSLIIAIFRDSYLYQREKHHKKHRHRKLYNNPMVFVFFFAVYTVMIIQNISNPVNILPLLAGIVYFCFEWFTTNKTTLKIAASITNIPWIIFDVLSLSYAGIVSDVISYIAAFAGIMNDKKKRQRRRRS